MREAGPSGPASFFPHGRTLEQPAPTDARASTRKGDIGADHQESGDERPPERDESGEQCRTDGQRSCALLAPAHLQHDVGPAKEAHHEMPEHMEHRAAVIPQRGGLTESPLVKVRARAGDRYADSHYETCKQ